MNESDLQVFIDATVNYFKQASDVTATVEVPYLKSVTETVAYQYTGIIGISGKKKGCVYFTAPSVLVKHLLMSIGETDTSRDSVCDLVGEVANTIAGNARQYFGPEFMISVPVVVDGQPDRIKLPQNTRAFIIPVVWRLYESRIVICLE